MFSRKVKRPSSRANRLIQPSVVFGSLLVGERLNVLSLFTVILYFVEFMCMHYRSDNLSWEFRNDVEKLSDGRMDLMILSVGVTGRYQVNDTHLHKTLKDHTRKRACGKPNVCRYRHNKSPELLWWAVQYISKQIPDEDYNLIKKGWDQMYMDRIREEGFLSWTRETRADWQENQKKSQEKARVEASQDRWITISWMVS